MSSVPGSGRSSSNPGKGEKINKYSHLFWVRILIAVTVKVCKLLFIYMQIWDPRLKTGTSPPSCQLLDNRLCISKPRLWPGILSLNHRVKGMAAIPKRVK